MSQFELFHPDTQILGRAILDFQHAEGAERLYAILQRHGLTDLDPNTWYPAQPWVDALNDIAGSRGAMMDFVSLGMRQMELIEWPVEFDQMDLVDALHALDELYRMNYRGTDVGGIYVEVIRDGLVKVHIRAFEPDDLWYGNLYGFVKKFMRHNSNFIVSYDNSQPRRDEGGEETVIRIEWE